MQNAKSKNKLKDINKLQYFVKPLKMVRDKNDLKEIQAVKVTQSKIAEQFCREIFDPEQMEVRETFFAVYTNRANNITAYQEISRGSENATIVNIRAIIYGALEVGASAIILAHNHPSGMLTPSTPDRNITDQIKQAAKLFDLVILDHVILTENSYLSFADEGML